MTTECYAHALEYISMPIIVIFMFFRRRILKCVKFYCAVINPIIRQLVTAYLFNTSMKEIAVSRK